MDKNDIIEYVMHTPHNTNRAVLSSMLNQLAEGGGGGGGGDLSTAQVTCINSSSEPEIVLIMAYEDDEWAEGSFTQVFVEQEATVSAILYRGKCAAIINASGAPVVIAGTGDVTINGFNAYITGDCTITLSDTE